MGSLLVVLKLSFVLYPTGIEVFFVGRLLSAGCDDAYLVVGRMAVLHTLIAPSAMTSYLY